MQRIAQLDKYNVVVNVIVLETLEDAPKYVLGETANIGDIYNPNTNTFTPPNPAGE